MTDLIDIPVLRVAPPSLAHLIDAVEPNARLLYAGEGRWRLWRLATSPLERLRRRITGAKLLDGMMALDGFRFGKGRDAARVLQATMALRGYAWEWTYEVGAGEPNSSIADDFRVRLWGERQMREGDLDNLISLAAGDDRLERRKAAIAGHTRLEGPAAHRWAFRKPVSIINPLPNGFTS